MEYVLSILWILLDITSSVIFTASFSKLRWNKKRTMVIMMTALVSAALIIFLVPGESYRIGTIGIMLVLVITIFYGSWQKQLLSVLLSIVLIGIIDTSLLYGVSAILNITYDELIWKKMLYTIVTTSTKLIEVLLAYFFCKYWRGRKTAPICSSWLLLTMLFPAVSLVMLLIIYVGFQDRSDMSAGALIFTLALAMANVAIIYLIHVMEKRTREEQQLHLINQQMEIQTENILALEKSYRSQRAATHEFRNQLQTISDLMSCRKYEEAQDYLHQIQDSQKAGILAVNTHHPIMDAILNQKYQVAVDHNIDIQIQVNDLSGLCIPTNSLVVLFSNLLDNAIEACLRMPDNRVIRCSIVASDELYLSIRNTSLPVTITDGQIQTSKKEKQEHGFGLLSIKRILDELKGEYAFQYDHGWFQFAAEIPL